MNKRQELLAAYLRQLVKEKGPEIFTDYQGNHVQILVCMYVVEDLYEMMGKKSKPLEQKKNAEAGR